MSEYTAAGFVVETEDLPHADEERRNKKACTSIKGQAFNEYHQQQIRLVLCQS